MIGFDSRLAYSECQLTTDGDNMTLTYPLWQLVDMIRHQDQKLDNPTVLHNEELFSLEFERFRTYLDALHGHAREWENERQNGVADANARKWRVPGDWKIETLDQLHNRIIGYNRQLRTAATPTEMYLAAYSRQAVMNELHNRASEEN
jgi:hypothetical protein